MIHDPRCVCARVGCLAIASPRQEGKAEAAQLDRLRVEVGKMVHEANTSVATLRQNVGNVVNDVREHFKTASQTISAHNATFISEVRASYQQDAWAAPAESSSRSWLRFWLRL